eukprot:38356-Chlamydomonas_euryale.AAC.1
MYFPNPRTLLSRRGGGGGLRNTWRVPCNSCHADPKQPPRPAACVPRPAARVPRPDARVPRPDACGPRPAACVPRPAACVPHPAAADTCNSLGCGPLPAATGPTSLKLHMLACAQQMFRVPLQHLAGRPVSDMRLRGGCLCALSPRARTGHPSLASRPERAHALRGA